MRAGLLDKRITLQRKTTTQSPSGEPIEAWTNIVTRRPASVNPLQGSERFIGEQLGALQQIEIRVRWSQNIADLSPLDRVVYPAEAATDSPSLKRAFYNILSVDEMGRKEEFRIIAARHTDVS